MKKTLIFTVMLVCALVPGFSQQISSINVFNGNGYEVVNQPMGWEEARREAERRGGKLAAITSAEENTFVLSLIMRQGNTNFYWLGGQADRNRSWSWVTGEPFNYSNWGHGNPDNYEGRQDKISISRIYLPWAGIGEWDDENNSTQYGFVIEYPAGAFVPVEAAVVQGNNFAEKLEWLNVFAQNNTNYIIEVRANENQDIRLSYSGKSGITIILKGIGANRTINGNVEVGSGITLILDSNITLALRSVALEVKSGGLLIMNNGTAITGEGITVANQGSVYMKGGTISGGYRKVEIRGGSFVMENGTISGKRISESGGAVFVTRDGTFTMTGGTISGNTGNGVDVAGESSYSDTYSGTFTMTGGIISGNTGNGVKIRAKGTFTMTGGTISGNAGGGVDVSGTSQGRRATFIMTGGTISGNTSTYGGGVYVGQDGTFTMNDGTISGNTSTYGGGVYVWGGMYWDGYGIRTQGGGIFTKTGGTITGYTSDQRNGNVVKNESGAVQNYKGHAVYAGSTETLLKIREGTAGPGDTMSYDGTKRPPTAEGAWDN